MRRRTAAAATAALTALATLTVPAAAMVEPSPAPAESAARPNIVVIMVDDMSSEIADYMGEVKRLERNGVSFGKFFVSNSLCCPSRATFLTGKYPHNSKVKGNYWPDGGFARFLVNDEETSVGPYLSNAGYRTGLIGKYLNEYDPEGDTDGVNPPDYPRGYVPPGWDEWFVPGFGYQEFDYQAVDSVDGQTRVVEYAGGDEADYLTDVMRTRAGEFIDRATGADAKPFFLTLTPFAVHGITGGTDPQQPDAPRFPPAPRDRADSPNRPADWAEPEFANGDCGDRTGGGCADVPFPDPGWGAFNQPVTDPPSHAPTEPLSQATLDSYEQHHVERIQMAQAVDDLIRGVRDDLATAGVADNTYIVFTSDNGFHLGQHGLRSGKGTAYDHDIRVPLVVSPPGGTAARTERSIAQNTDLLPTLLDIADAPVPGGVDGRSLLPLVNGASPTWRETAFVEYYGYQDRPDGERLDPDRADVAERTPPYVALRTSKYLYVDYSTLDGSPPKAARAEYFKLRSDPDMLHNVYGDLRKPRRDALNAAANDYAVCSGAGCWDAGLTSR